MFRSLFLTLTHLWRLFQFIFIRASVSDILSALRDCQLSIQVFVSYWMLMVNVECCLNNICFRKIIEVFIFISCIDFLFINKSESPWWKTNIFYFAILVASSALKSKFLLKRRRNQKYQ